MSQHYVTAKGKCTYCGAQLRQCDVCPDWFIASNKRHKTCSSRCRTRKSRLKKTQLVWPGHLIRQD